MKSFYQTGFFLLLYYIQVPAVEERQIDRSEKNDENADRLGFIRYFLCRIFIQTWTKERRMIFFYKDFNLTIQSCCHYKGKEHTYKKMVKFHMY